MELLKNWDEINQIQNDFNQRSFQKAIFTSMANGKSLPLENFPSGIIYFEQMPSNMRNRVFIIHNNFIVGKVKKIHRFKHFELWYSKKEGKCYNFF